MAFQRQHDPDAVLDYPVDWSAWLASGETIATSTWAASSADLTIENQLNTTTVATAWISGGVAGKIYTLTNHIVTSAGREEDRSITLVCTQR